MFYIEDIIEEKYQYKITKIILFFLFFILLNFIQKSNNNKSFKNEKIPKVDDIFNLNMTFIESHRGINKEFFENTLESFSRAINYSIDCLETDVWLTKDKVLAIVHGRGIKGTLKKYYGTSKSITNLTWKKISKLRTIKDNLKMPKLDQVFKLAKNKIIINLEIKDPRIDLIFPKIMKLVEKYDFYEQIFFTSFFKECYYKIIEYNKKHGKNIRFQFAYLTNETEYDYSKKGHIISVYWKNVNKEICDKAHSNGMAVSASLRFDDEYISIYRKLFDYGIDIISCNSPDIAKRYRDYYYKKYPK